MDASGDIVVIGSGMGGATAAYALAQSGRSVVILERGLKLDESPKARDEQAIFEEGHYRPHEHWVDSNGEIFNPGNYYYVGGNTKFYGAVLLRYRAEDFNKLQHTGGVSPAWPMSYEHLEPWYQAAEKLFNVRGTVNEDPTEPPHSVRYPYPPVADEESILEFRQRLVSAGVTPSSLPLGIDIDRWLERAETPWDAFPDTTGAKMDAESVSVKKALSFPNASLETGIEVTRLITDASGHISELEYRKNKQVRRRKVNLVVLSAGAVNSAALLLKSANQRYPNGLANSSDQVGRNFMNHNCSAVLAINPFIKNTSVFQKTLQFNDFYLRGGVDDMPLGNVQLLGKISGTILASQSSLPRFFANWIARHSVDCYAMSEDLPNPDSRVTIKDGRIHLDWKKSNFDTHKALIKKTKKVLRKAGYPIVISRAFDRKTPSHQCGTTKIGIDPKTSVLDTYCRSHDHENLFVVDAGFLPTSAAVNPALTIAAQALRVGAHIVEKEGSVS